MLSNYNYVWSQNHCSHGRKERTWCTEAALGRSSLHLCNLHSTQLLWHLLPSGKYGIAILERFDIPGEPVKSGGKGTWVCLYIHCSMLPFVSACVNLLCPHNIFNCTFTYVLRNCISSSSWLDICELQIHLHRCTHWWLQGVPWKQCTTRGVRVGEGWPWVLPSSAFSAVGGGSPAVPQPSFRDFVASRRASTSPCASRPCPWAGVLAPLV